jgi:cardiolipin synthase
VTVRPAAQRQAEERASRSGARALADQAFSRAAGAALIGGNRVRLLRDAAENYPAWLEAIAAARRFVHFESYIIHEDETGRRFADALIDKARAGIPVRLLYDWLGGVGKTSRRFWRRLRDGGVEVRCHNPPRLDSPLGWLSRDHRKMLGVDGEVGFVSGLCVGRMWTGEPGKGIEPWRDTGVEVRGPAVADVEQAFAQVWDLGGAPLAADERVASDAIAPAGDVSLRIVASVPATAGLLRVNQLVAGLARERLWLTDAYYAGTASYVQALRAAARDGVDVRLLLPGATDIPIVRALSRSGYRTLLEAGVRVFEWNGTMIHAKTSVADRRWSRVGSTNLNLASWFGNCELDAVIEDEGFARQMEEMYLEDLARATEVVLDRARHLRPAGGGGPRRARRLLTSGGGGVVRATAGAARLGHAVGAAFTGRRVLEPIEARLAVGGGAALLGLALLFAIFPRALAVPAVALLAWLGLALLYRGVKLLRARRREAATARALVAAGAQTLEDRTP